MRRQMDRAVRKASSVLIHKLRAASSNRGWEKKLLIVFLIGKNVDQCLNNLIATKMLSEWSYANMFHARRCE